ncbi:hypothetical protein ACQJBY_032679 [Aegilops geniculata]
MGKALTDGTHPTQPSLLAIELLLFPMAATHAAHCERGPGEDGFSEQASFHGFLVHENLCSADIKHPVLWCGSGITRI